MFNTDTTPGQAFDGIFYFSGRGLNWDPYGHHPAGTGASFSQLPITGIKEAGNTVTVTLNGTQYPTVGGQVVITGVTPAGYNGTFAIASSSGGATTSTFTFNDPTTGLGSGTGGTATVTIGSNIPPNDPESSLTCTPDANGYNTGNPGCPELLRVVPGP